MTGTGEHISRLEAFFRQRSDAPESVKVTDYEPITGGYSRLMARVWVEDANGRVGYVVRSDPPPVSRSWKPTGARSGMCYRAPQQWCDRDACAALVRRR